MRFCPLPRFGSVMPGRLATHLWAPARLLLEPFLGGVILSSPQRTDQDQTTQDFATFSLVPIRRERINLLSSSSFQIRLVSSWTVFHMSRFCASRVMALPGSEGPGAVKCWAGPPDVSRVCLP